MIDLAFVGDVHGNAAALRGIVGALSGCGPLHIVFLGDYVNKGTDSAEVLSELIRLQEAGEATLLAGNHELELLRSLDSGDLRPFLKMGGAMTIRSYVGTSVPSDVVSAFRASVPADHLNALRRMATRYENSFLIAQHAPPLSGPKYRISAHVEVGPLPAINEESAQLDTGCGSGGRLTALLWPSREYLQVDSAGNVVVDSRTLR